MTRRHAAVAVALAALLLSAPLTVTLAEVAGPPYYGGPNNGHYHAGTSAGRCGAFTGSQAVEASKQQQHDAPQLVMSDASPGGSSFSDDLVVCKKHLREHATKLRHSKFEGTKLELQVFADSADLPSSSSDFDVSESAKSSSVSSPAVSSSSDSVAPELTSVSFIAELTPVNPSGRRHMLQAFVTATPTDEEVTAVNSWLGDFARDNSDVVDGRDSITATSFKRGTGGQIFFTVFILTSDPATVEARIVALPEYSSPVGDAVLSEPQPCSSGEDVRFGAAEDLVAQLSVAPPSGCSNPLDPVVAAPAPDPPSEATTPSVTTTLDFSCC